MLQNLKPSFQQLLGNTRLVYLKHFSELTGCNILGKCEYENPGGSIKDRAALSMILGAEEKGKLVRGEPGIIIEGTAGNTGIGLALAAKVLGYQCVICIADTQSQEKKNFLKWAGAHLVEVPAVPFKNPNNYVHVAERISNFLTQKQEMRSFYANQWDNLDNRKAHVNGTAREMISQAKQIFDLDLDCFSCAVGTGGTISGFKQHVDENDLNIKVCLTDPKGAGLVNYFNHGELKAEGSSITEGIGQNRITGNLEGFKPDIAVEVDDQAMINTLIDLQQHEGLSLGTSSGINVAGAVKIAKILGPGHTIATVLCDLGQRYSSKIYNEKFLHSKQLPVAPWLLTKNKLKEDRSEFELLLEEALKQSLINQ